MIGVFNIHTVAGKREKQTRYLSQAIQLEEAVNPHIIRATMSMVSFAVAAFLLWAGFTNINEVARTPGEVVPYGYQQTVQHLEGGIIKAIYVDEGDVVQQGQKLVELSDASVQEDMERATSKQLSVDMQIERLRAYVEGREPDFSQFKDAPAKMISDQLAFFRGMRRAKEKETQVVKEQLQQKEQLLESYQSQLATAKESHAIVNNIYERRKTLSEKGYAPEMQLLEDRRRLNDISGDINRLENQILVAKKERDEFDTRLASMSARHIDDAHRELDKALIEKDQNDKIISKLKERIGRLVIRAPVHGLVKGLVVNTIGSVVQPGQTIMEIVPLDKKLEVEVKISPKDIGHLFPGQKVQVKVSTYDFSRYGSVQGKLERISATTFNGNNGERYYQGQVVLDKNYVGGNPANTVMPGMTVMANIITGDKTILQYLLKPIQISLTTAFTER